MNKSRNINFEVGDRLELKCLSLGSKGDGIFKQNNIVIIAAEAQIGKNYLIEISKIKENYAFGQILEEI